MSARTLCVALLLLGSVSLASLPLVSSAAITAEHRKQLDDVKKELGKVPGLISKKQIDEATQLLDDAEKKLKEIAQDAGVDEKNKLIAGLLKQVEQKRTGLAKKQGGGEGGGGGPFEKDVAPVLVARCISCHGGDNPRAGLSLETFGGIVQGCNGKLVVPNNPAASMLMRRITASGNERMPKDDNALSPDEIKKISAWIASGARFSGNNTTPLFELANTGKGPTKKEEPLEIAMANGNEKVSFKRDIAPFMVNVCLNCHGGNNPRSGFALDTFEKLMKGGKSGRVLRPGNTKDSRLWHLVGEQDPIKMPPGQLLITRSNHANLKVWIEEGCKFDGGDAKAPLRSLVPTAAEERARELAAMSPEELVERRKSLSHEQWSSALSQETPAEKETEEFVVIGNADEARLQELANWAEEDAKTLRKVFGVKDTPLWRGKLAIFVFKDRFAYAEFVQSIERAEVPAETTGHARVSTTQDDAYVCLQDQGDTADEQTPGARAMLMNLLTEALLQRAEKRAPNWAARGIGLALAAKHDPKNPYFRGLAAAALEVVKTFSQPENVFDGDAFSAADLSPIGYTLVTHMQKVGGEPSFVQFLSQLTAGRSLPEALKTVYSADTASIARSYVGSLSSAKPTPKKGKK